VDFLYYTDLDETVKVIHNAGGVAILAHWSFSKSKVDKKMIEKLFKENRLDGAEITFGLGVTERQEEIKKDMETMKRLTEKWDKLQSGGADIHKGEDFKYFVEAKWYAEKTIGLTERMIKQMHIIPQFSSFAV
jgi:predicted metal-dependent phosphoesterase TrpH